MKIGDVVKGRYESRGDVVDVTQVVPGKTLRASRVRFVLRKKGRLTGTLEVGDLGELGIVNFASWSEPIGRPKAAPGAKRAGRQA